MRFHTVLFDLDGTLIDAFTTIHRAYGHTLSHFGRPAPSMEDVRGSVGGGLRNGLRHFFPEEEIDAALSVYLSFMDKSLLEDVHPLPGSLELLQALQARGVTAAVLTNKSGNSARRLCQHFRFTPCLKAIYGGNDTQWVKPQAEFARFALDALKAEPDSTLLVGDSPFDIQTAKNGRFTCWAVSTGTHSAEELHAAGADAVYKNLTTLAADLI